MLRLNTTQLCRGDVVLTHGMRVLLDRDLIITPRGDIPGGAWDVYAWHGTVLNRDDVVAGPHPVVPAAFLRTEKFDPAHGWVTDREDHWSIQGNELAHWDVERGA